MDILRVFLLVYSHVVVSGNYADETCLLSWTIVHGRLADLDTFRKYHRMNDQTVDRCVQICASFTPPCLAAYLEYGHCYIAIWDFTLEVDADQPGFVYMPNFCKGCPNYWEKHLKWQSNGGIIKPYKAPIMCLVQCQAQPSCLAVDFNYNTSTCYFHTSRHALQSMKGYDERVMQFRITRTPSNVNCSGCRDEWSDAESKTTDIKEFFEFSKTSVMSAADCQLACTWDINCLGIEYHVSGGLCYLLVTTESLTQAKKINDPFIFHTYIFRRGDFCAGCTPIWYEYKSKAVPDSGIFIPNGHTAKQCKDLCEENSHCIAVDFKEKTKSCRHHFYLEMEYELKPDNATHYVIHRCGDCRIRWVIMPRHIYTGDSFGPSLSVRHCQLECVKNKNCRGVDFNEFNKTCAMHTDLSKVIEIEPSTSSTHYRLVKDGDFCQEEKFGQNPSLTCNHLNNICYKKDHDCCLDEYCFSYVSSRGNCARCRGIYQKCQRNEDCCFPLTCSYYVCTV